MIQFDQVTLHRGVKRLVHEVSFAVHSGWKIGLVGPNGCGKSSFLAMLDRRVEPDAGQAQIPPQLRIATVAQELAAGTMSGVEFVLEGDAQLTALSAELTSAQQRGDGVRIAELHADLEHAGFYRARANAATVLHGLGFSTEQMAQPVDALSGGWRMRLNLARALAAPSDMLLLDEPTNHLDLDAIIWLEDWLKRYRGTAWIVSHDRDFLDAISTHIANFENENIVLYTGNYSSYEAQRGARMALQKAQFEKQRREIEHAREFIARFRAKASKAKQAQSRMKALERMETIIPAHVDAPFSFTFREVAASGSPLLAIRDGVLGYDGAKVLTGVNITLAPGDRVALIGPNGAGKSTLVKSLAGQLPVQAGERAMAKDARIGYFAQHQLDQLRLDATPLEHVQRLDPRGREQDLRDFLGGFGFDGEKATAVITPFSGGEKARLVLALLAYQKPHILLLDEPTNHLDIDMRQALATALQDFSGAIVLVSHDRHLIRCTADTLLLVSHGKVSSFDGDIDGYAQWLLDHYRRDEQCDARVEPAQSRRDQRRVEAETRQRLQPLRQKVKRLEDELQQLQTRKQALVDALADASIYAPERKDELKARLHDQRVLAELVARTEEQWLEAVGALEEAT